LNITVTLVIEHFSRKLGLFTRGF